MCKVALGVLGVPLSDFLLWTVKDYLLAVDGYNKKERSEWLKVQTMCYYSVVSFQGSKGISFDDIATPFNEKKDYRDKKRAKWRKLK